MSRVAPNDPPTVQELVDETLRSVPLDLQGPEWSGNPNQRHKKQKFRPRTQRWANSGGKLKDKYDIWRQKSKDPFYHPKSKIGYFYLKELGYDHAAACAMAPR